MWLIGLYHVFLAYALSGLCKNTHLRDKSCQIIYESKRRFCTLAPPGNHNEKKETKNSVYWVCSLYYWIPEEILFIDSVSILSLLLEFRKQFSSSVSACFFPFVFFRGKRSENSLNRDETFPRLPLRKWWNVARRFFSRPSLFDNCVRSSLHDVNAARLHLVREEKLLSAKFISLSCSITMKMTSTLYSVVVRWVTILRSGNVFECLSLSVWRQWSSTQFAVNRFVNLRTHVSRHLLCLLCFVRNVVRITVVETRVIAQESIEIIELVLNEISNKREARKQFRTLMLL